MPANNNIQRLEKKFKPVLYTQSDILLRGEIEQTSHDHNPFSSQYHGLTRTTNFESLRTRQNIFRELLADASVFDYLNRFYSHMKDGYMEGLAGKSPFLDRTPVLNFPEPVIYTGKNKYMQTWFKTLKDVNPEVATLDYISQLFELPIDTERDIRKLNELVLLVIRQSVPFVVGTEYLSTLRERVPITEASFIDEQKINIENATPMDVGFGENRIPMSLTLDPENYAGAIIVGPNNAGKSIVLEQILQPVLYHTMMAGFSPGNKVEIGWLPDATINIDRDRTKGCITGDIYSAGYFEALVLRLYKDLARIKNQSKKTLVVVDDLFESTAGKAGVKRLYEKFRELHEKYGVYIVSTLRSVELAEELCDTAGFQRIGITKGHKVVQGQFVTDDAAISIVDRIHDDFVHSRLSH